MNDPANLHSRLQDYADCFLETDPEEGLREISEKGISGEVSGNMTELALKYLSLAILYGVEKDARRIMIFSEGDMAGTCKLMGEEEIQLPQPPAGLSGEMHRIMRSITHLDADDELSRRLIYGLRGDRLEIDVALVSANDAGVMVLDLPKVWIH